VTGGTASSAVDDMVAEADRGAVDHGAAIACYRVGVDHADHVDLTEAALAADAILFATPIVLYGWPADFKAWLDSWLPARTITSRTAGMAAGYLAAYEPDDAAIPAAFDAAFRGLCDYVGFQFRGKYALSLPRRADGEAAAVARQLGAVLAGRGGYAGYPDEYLAGIVRFNESEFWEAHEEWEDIWLEAEDGYRLFFQGLIQVAAGFHHHGHDNWGGMASLLHDGAEKLRAYRPRMLGLDVDALLAAVEPWRVLAAARVGDAAPVVRIPGAYPRIELDVLG